jgi:hypothetical protein
VTVIKLKFCRDCVGAGKTNNDFRGEKMLTSCLAVVWNVDILVPDEGGGGATGAGARATYISNVQMMARWRNGAKI